MNANKLALVVAYYIARFNKDGVEKLGFASFRDAFDEASKRLGVNKNYIKLRRDEFDQIFPWRTGWRAPLSKQVIRTINAFNDVDEADLRDIVSRILSDHNYRNSDEAEEITHLLNEPNSKEESSNKTRFILRLPTGKKAEEFFIQFHKMYEKPFPGSLKDTRDLGCGYDFELVRPKDSCFIEVKGLSSVSGGVVFTNKEWQTATAFGDSYFLAVVSNLDDKPEIMFIQNPALALKAKKSIYTSIQIQWAVLEKDLMKKRSSEN